MMPDPILLQTTGFSPTEQRFRYSVNARFGDVGVAPTQLRTPFGVTLAVKANLGAAIGVQQLERFLRPGRAGNPGKKLTAAELKLRYRRNVRDPYVGILSEADSLLLQREQVEALVAAQARYLTRVDSVWTELCEYLAGLPDDFSAAQVLQRQERVVDAVWELSRLDVRAVLPTILTPIQLRLLPGQAALLLRATGPIKGVRTYFYGDP
jgi:hypothetical protein